MRRHFWMIQILTVTLWSVILPSWADSSATDRNIAQAQRKIQRNAKNPRAYYQLGDAYIHKARESGDVTYYNLAEEALHKSLSLDAGQSGVLRHLAYVLSMHHDFPQAAKEAQHAIDLDPTDYDAYGVLGDAQLEIGQYEQAQQTYEKMIRIKKDLSSYSRLSGLKSLKGDAKGAITDLEQAIHAGKASNQPKESVAWAQWQLGIEHFNIGHLKHAEKQFKAALATYPNYYRANAGLAQVRAAQKKYDEAITRYQTALSVVPMPEYAIALGDLYKKLGRLEDAKKQYDLVEYIGHLNSLNNVIYNRDLGYFYADHDTKLPEALALARKEFDVRKDIYGYDLLAWSLYKNDQPEEAKAAMAEALKLGTKDAKLFYHAGMIYKKLGESTQAMEFLQRALKTNPFFHPLYANVAREALKELKDQTKTAEVSQKVEKGESGNGN